ncbi:hypothetical protein M0R72_03730 [Candidatus Pacearchaeota archaeon]|jgi:hypothetical protein|nr:hypothetical protein [Candidatus Pacearchaeota archaeon]
MTEKFKWGDETTPKENHNLEKQVTTEQDYNDFIEEKKKSLDEFGIGQYLEDFEQKESLKKQGISLRYYRVRDEVYYSFNIKPNLGSVFKDNPNS